MSRVESEQRIDRFLSVFSVKLWSSRFPCVVACLVRVAFRVCRLALVRFGLPHSSGLMHFATSSLH